MKRWIVPCILALVLVPDSPTIAKPRITKQQRQQAKTLFEMGEKSLSRGSALEAEYYFRKAAEKDPNTPRYRKKHQEVLTQASKEAEAVGRRELSTDVNKAKEWLSKAVEFDPENTSSADALSSIGNSDREAQECLRSAVERAEQGDIPTAENYLERAREYSSAVEEFRSAAKHVNGVKAVLLARQQWDEGARTKRSERQPRHTN